MICTNKQNKTKNIHNPIEIYVDYDKERVVKNNKKFYHLAT